MCIREPTLQIHVHVHFLQPIVLKTLSDRMPFSDDKGLIISPFTIASIVKCYQQLKLQLRGLNL